MPVFIPDIFSGYLEGVRKANQDNWSDASNYNKVLQGQLNNAYAMATFDPAVRMAWNNAAMSNYNNALQGANADRQLRNYAMNLQYGIDPLSAQNMAQALTLNQQTNAQQAAINSMNAQDQLAHGADDAAMKREAQRLQLEAAKRQLDNTQPSSSNPFAIGTGLSNNQQGTQQYDFTVPDLTVPFGNSGAYVSPANDGQRMSNARTALDNNGNLLTFPSL